MKRATVKEIEEKVVRLMQLEKMGFNIPRYCYVIHKPLRGITQMALDWAEEIHKQDPEQIFNIRTYAYDEKSKTESIKTPHVCDIKFENLENELQKLSNDFFCMVDAETPDNGRIAGNIAILEGRGFISKELKFYVDYCIKEKRAMVRDADSSGLHFNGVAKGLIKEKEGLEDNKLEQVLVMVVNKALHFHRTKKNFILEWTYFCKPAGIKREPLVWWEYRKYG